MQTVDATKFFDGVRTKFGPLSQSQVDGFNSLITNIETDAAIAYGCWDAYMLATVWHETATTCEPIEEYGKGHGRPYGVPDPVTGQTYYGRGYVQLTWKINYEKFTALLGVDLVDNPSLALHPFNAYRIMSIGMTKGLFTGKSLEDYTNAGDLDYVNARRIINGLDRADLIAGYAESFEAILTAATVTSNPLTTATVTATTDTTGDRSS
jgi:putative chitinase